MRWNARSSSSISGGTRSTSGWPRRCTGLAAARPDPDVRRLLLCALSLLARPSQLLRARDRGPGLGRHHALFLRACALGGGNRSGAAATLRAPTTERRLTGQTLEHLIRGVADAGQLLGHRLALVEPGRRLGLRRAKNAPEVFS